MTSPTAATRRRTARPRLDAVAADAVELARTALEDVTEPGQVGEHLRVEASGDRLVTHVFECTMPGYRGWAWVAVLARAPRAKAATVAETALLPVEDALLAPEWEPWSERLKPEDVGADDLLPFHEQDERLEQGYEATGEEDEDRVAQWELGLGRTRVLSPQGRSDAAERWIEGEFGPRQTSGRGRRGTVSANCSSCGFLTLMAGSLRGEFGVCTNQWSPADGRVVHLGYGCGAHSETGKDDPERSTRNGGVVVDELDVEFQKPAEDTSEGTPGETTDREQTPAAEGQGPAAEGDGSAAEGDGSAVAEQTPTAEPVLVTPADGTSEPAGEAAPAQTPEGTTGTGEAPAQTPEDSAGEASEQIPES